MRAGAEALTGPSDTLSGQIRIGAPDGSANYILPQVCAQICEEHPDLDIQILALPRVINLSRREADMAVTVSAPTAGQLLVQKLTDYKLHMKSTTSLAFTVSSMRVFASLICLFLSAVPPVAVLFDIWLEFKINPDRQHCQSSNDDQDFVHSGALVVRARACNSPLAPSILPLSAA